MSQYPPSHPPPPYGQPPFDFSQYVPPAQADLLAPARRAGTLMMVLGALVAMFGFCNAGSAFTTSPEQMAEQQAALRTPGMPESPLSPRGMQIATAVAGVLTLLVGVTLAVNGTYVRRGSSLATTLGLVMAGGLTLLIGLFVLLSVAAAFGAPMFGAFACVLAVPLGLLIWLLVWLVAAARNNAAVGAAQQQYQAQFYAYQQQQQAYGQPAPAAYPPQPPGYGAAGYAYGYGYPPPPPAASQGYAAPAQQQQAPSQLPPQLPPQAPSPPPSAISSETPDDRLRPTDGDEPR